MYPTVYLAAEDEPGLAVGRKLLAEAPPLAVYTEFNGHGYGELKKKVKSYQQMGTLGVPVLMITDLDDRLCPSVMIDDWLGTAPSRGFLFRICVREVESWLLADREALAGFLGLPVRRMPMAPDSLSDPKAKLIALAQLSPKRAIRTGFKPLGTSTIGPDYNSLIADFVLAEWNAGDASTNSPSLARARKSLGLLAASLA